MSVWDRILLVGMPKKGRSLRKSEKRGARNALDKFAAEVSKPVHPMALLKSRAAKSKRRK